MVVMTLHQKLAVRNPLPMVPAVNLLLLQKMMPRMIVMVERLGTDLYMSKVHKISGVWS